MGCGEGEAARRPAALGYKGRLPSLPASPKAPTSAPPICSPASFELLSLPENQREMATSMPSPKSPCSQSRNDDRI